MERHTEVREINIDEIVIGKRHRKDMGSISMLALSIETVGLLQPIGVSPDLQLVYGQRRLLAVQALGWKTIPARIVRLDDLLQAEHDENEVRKEFTVSERVAIAKAIKEAIGDRQGQRTDKKNGSGEEEKELPQNFAEVQSGKETREAAAKKAGFGNHETFRQAESVVEQGTPELIDAMDDETLSVNAAADAATLPPDAQRQVVEEVKAGAKPRQAIEDAKAKVGAGQVDDWGIPIQPHAKEAFEAVSQFNELIDLLKRAAKQFNALANSPGGKFLTLPSVSSYRRGKKQEDGTYDDRFVHTGIERAIKQLQESMPRHTACPYHYVDGPHPEPVSESDSPCRTCLGLNWTPKLGKSVPEIAKERQRRAFGV